MHASARPHNVGAHTLHNSMLTSAAAAARRSVSVYKLHGNLLAFPHIRAGARLHPDHIIRWCIINLCVCIVWMCAAAAAAAASALASKKVSTTHGGGTIAHACSQMFARAHTRNALMHAVSTHIEHCWLAGASGRRVKWFRSHSDRAGVCSVHIHRALTIKCCNCAGDNGGVNVRAQWA